MQYLASSTFPRRAQHPARRAQASRRARGRARRARPPPAALLGAARAAAIGRSPPDDAARRVACALLDAAVAKRLVADVPVGVFLSGGVDSTAIAALAVRHQRPLQTFSIGFDRGELRRVALRGAGRAAPRHRAPRGEVFRAGLPRPACPPRRPRSTSRSPTRASCPRSALALHAQAREGGARRRRRRRALRGLRSVPRAPAGGGFRPRPPAARARRRRRGAPAARLVAEHEPRLPAQAVPPRRRRADPRCGMRRGSPPSAPRDGVAAASGIPPSATADVAFRAVLEDAAAQRSAARLGGRGAALLPDPLPRRRHPGEGRPRVDGGVARAARAVPGHRGGGVRRAPALAAQDVAHPHQADPQARAARPGARGDPAQAQEGLRHSRGGLDSRATAAALRGPALRAQAARGRRSSSPRRCARCCRPHLDGRADLRKPLWTLLMFQLWHQHHAQSISLRTAA